VLGYDPRPPHYVTSRYVLRMPLDNSVREVELTSEQLATLEAGEAIAWYSPEVPHITVDDDGTITEHEDARPQLPDAL
jgi:hypothetical protein